MDVYSLGFVYGALAVGVVWGLKEVLVYVVGLQKRLLEYEKEENVPFGGDN